MLRKNLFGVFTAIAAATLFAVMPAQAATYTFDFESTNSGYLDAMGGFTTDATNHLTAISGNVSGLLASGAITGLVAGSSPYTAPSGNSWTFSDTYSPSSQTFNGDGVLFAFDGGNFGNIYNTGSGGVGGETYFSVNLPQSGFIPGVIGLLQVAETPIPAALPLFGSVLAGGLLFLRRKRKAQQGASLGSNMVPA